MHYIFIIFSVSFITTILSAPSNVSSRHAAVGKIKSFTKLASLVESKSATILNEKVNKKLSKQGKLITKTKPVAVDIYLNKIRKKKIEYDPKIHGPTKAFRMISQQGSPYQRKFSTDFQNLYLYSYRKYYLSRKQILMVNFTWRNTKSEWQVWK